MNLLFIGMTMGVVGKIMLAYGVVLVHIKMAKERRIDEIVVSSFRTEMFITLAGVLFIVVGYFLEVSFLGGFNYLVHCTGEACGAALGNLLLQ